MGNYKDISGQKFGKLSVLSKSERPSCDSGIFWDCKCDCGNDITVLGSSLRNGNTKSCGCFKSETAKKTHTKHGYTKNHNAIPIYDVWYAMKHRCFNKNNPEYHRYGGRGIMVCDEWFDSATFINWAFSNGYERGLTLERKDNDGNYEPDNCQWTDRVSQQRNMGIFSNNSTGYKGVSFHNQTKKYRAYITINYKQIYLGLFDTIEDAIAARRIAEKKYWHKE